MIIEEKTKRSMNVSTFGNEIPSSLSENKLRKMEEENVYDRSSNWKRNVEFKKAKWRHSQEEMKLKECTFRPNLIKSSVCNNHLIEKYKII